MNEAKTINLVYDHFRGHDNIILEREKSDNPIIQKPLKTASKAGNKQGRPDFIISFEDNDEFIIVIECKPNPAKHKSKTLDLFKDYAVDGALLYSSYLSREYDVLSIAVSGETEHDLKITHHLQLKKDKVAKPFLGEELLAPSNYLHAYQKSDYKFKSDYSDLLRYTKTLNTKLHGFKIPEHRRALLLSGILISLENRAFKKGYNSYDSAKNLSKYLTTIVNQELSRASVRKAEIVVNSFSFIETHSVLSEKKNILKNLIHEIEENVYNFTKTHQYRDILGEMYIEFLRYANSDKGIGIVLTPPHITDFMARIAGVDKDSVVLDNCTGTSGFLISAMKLMIEDAKGDQEKIKQIKAKQLYGVEFQDHIYALAVSNMYIHQDGKTTLFKGSCFENDICDAIQKAKPTIGLLNPPYKADKKTDTEELDFLYNNLNNLVYGGTACALIPMSCATDLENSRIQACKEKLLKSHTLEAVLSMPDELFRNSKVGVNTCLMIFTAHKPHNFDRTTYFGSYKDDGFIYDKPNGRYDGLGSWGAKKKKWIDSYLNKENIPYFSINKKICSNEEWCAEEHFETSFNEIKDNLFVQTLHDYTIYLFSNKLIDSASKKSIAVKKELNESLWGKIRLNQLFEITGTISTTKKFLVEERSQGSYPRISTRATNNGANEFYDYYTEEGGVLTIDSAVVGYTAYQEVNFSATDHVEKLIPKFNMDKYVAMFLCTVINKEQYRFSYGRKACQYRLEKLKINIPIDLKGKPNYKFMRDYIKGLDYSASL